MRQIHVVKRKNLWFAISALMLLPGLIALVLFGLKPGLDFQGGTLLELRVPQTVNAQKVKEALHGTKIEHAMVQMSTTGSDSVALVRAEFLDNQEQIKVMDQLHAKLGKFETLRIEGVGPAVGNELLWNSLIAFGIVMAMIIAYLSIRFRLDYAVCAIIAMVHDVLIVLGIFSILGVTMGYEVDSLFVTALLTVAGFSMHDTIVVFDRIRENTKVAGPRTTKTFSEIADESINQTLARSINTSVTVLLTLGALLFFGGESVHNFVLAMFLGIAIGTFSSIFVASPLLALWRDWDVAKGKNRSMA